MPAIVALLALVLSACSGTALTVPEYATQLQEVTDAYIDEAQDLTESFQRTVEEQISELAESGEGNLLLLATAITSQETVQYLTLVEDAMARYTQKLEPMDPPQEVAEEHEDYVDALESVRLSMPETIDGVAEAHDLVGIQEAITNSGFNDGQLRLQAACRLLEEAVRAAGQGVDLGCAKHSDTG